MSLEPSTAVAVHDQLPIVEESRAKFNDDGTPKLFPGTTALCHLRRENGSQRSLIRSMTEHLPNVTFDQKKPSHVKLPESSWHVTILDIRVYNPETWTDGDPLAARDADMSKLLEKFIARKSELREHIPVKMKIDLGSGRHPRNGDTLVVPIEPYDADEAKKLRTIRETLGHDFDKSVSETFKFHITTHYQLRFCDENEFARIEECWVKAVERISEDVEAFELDRVELCNFDDMCRFDPTDSLSATLHVMREGVQS